jgi:putative transposase
MPRANRYYLPGAVWHITHRCHDQQFLLKFERDRLRWKQWLFQARKRYGLSILNYMATSNHVHMLVQDQGRGEISRSMQLIAGRTGQEYNQRKSRKGAFWEDRFFATAVASDNHLIRCLVYIDLNMVRAGVVDHPAQWKVCGFSEIQKLPQRYRIIDRQALCNLTQTPGDQALQTVHKHWVENGLSRGRPAREPAWTESVAVGSKDYVERVKALLGARAYHRSIERETEATHLIRDSV